MCCMLFFTQLMLHNSRPYSGTRQHNSRPYSGTRQHLSTTDFCGLNGCAVVRWRARASSRYGPPPIWPGRYGPWSSLVYGPAGQSIWPSHYGPGQGQKRYMDMSTFLAIIIIRNYFIWYHEPQTATTKKILYGWLKKVCRNDHNGSRVNPCEITRGLATDHLRFQGSKFAV